MAIIHTTPLKTIFETWERKLSDRAIVLFHDINVRERGFGVFKFWNEIKQKYPHFSFDHSNGLGILAYGANVPEKLDAFFSFNTNDAEAAAVKRYVSRYGELLTNAWHFARAKNQLVEKDLSVAEERNRAKHAASELKKAQEKLQEEKNSFKQKTDALEAAKSTIQGLEIKNKDLSARVSAQSKDLKELGYQLTVSSKFLKNSIFSKKKEEAAIAEVELLKKHLTKANKEHAQLTEELSEMQVQNSEQVSKTSAAHEIIQRKDTEMFVLIERDRDSRKKSELLQSMNLEYEESIRKLKSKIDEIENSTSWRALEPIRTFMLKIRRIF